MSLELATIDQYCELDKTSLKFKRDISQEEWIYVFKSLKMVEGCVQFWIGDCLAYRQQKWGMYDDIAEDTGMDKKTLWEYKNVSENIKPSARAEQLSYTHHREVASLPPDKQEIFLNKAIEEKLSVRELREVIKNDRSINEIPPLPSGKYRVIYADPPWKYSDEQNTPMLGGAVKHYPLMSIDQIINTRDSNGRLISDIIDNDAVLFIWVTSPILDECFQVIEAWRFEYKTSFVWDKVHHNMGHYNSVRHELLLVCTRGSCTPDNIKLFDSVQVIEKTDKHSEKPQEFRNIIETLYTKGRKIELFARSKHSGWDAWGNEI